MINYILREAGQKRTSASTRHVENRSNVMGGNLR
jgi:hypothetical protein